MKNPVFIPFRCCLFTVLFVLASRFAAADVIHVTTPISIPAGNTAVLNWNVDESEDGNGSIEFVISYVDFGFGTRSVNLREDPDNDPLSPHALITRDQKLVNLPIGFEIGTPLPGDLAWTREIEMLAVGGETLFGFDGFTENSPGIIGFSFERSGSTLYGWAKVTVIPGTDVDGDPVVPGLTISEWAYETTGGSLSVPVPEPSITAFLTLGTCGLVFRKRRSIRGLVGFRRGTDVPEGA